MTQYVPAFINDTYEIILPDFREEFHRCRPNWERGRLEHCHATMKSGMRVFDIGAEHGDFTTLYRQWVGPTGDVIPVEPATHYWSYIRETWEINEFPDPPAVSFTGLCADKPQNMPDGLWVKQWPPETNTEGVPDGGFIHLAHDDVQPRITIDALSLFVTPHAIVMDIEGAEWHALNGARHTMEKYQPLFWVSVHEPTMMNWYQKTPDDLNALMRNFGYGLEILPHHGEGEEFYFYHP